MAKYDVTHACGCEVTYQLYGKGTQRQAKIAWYERTDCSTCYRAKRDEREQAVVAEVAAECVLPALTGSEKQIAWAEKIRAAAIVAANVEIALWAAADQPALRAVRDELLALFGQSRTWIDRFRAPDSFVRAMCDKARADAAA